MKIKCPNCKNIVEPKTNLCPECSFNIYKFMDQNGFLDDNKKFLDNVYVCQECGNLGNISIEKIKTIHFYCNKCGSIYKPSGITEKEYWNNLEYYMNPENEHALVLETVGEIINLDTCNKLYEEKIQSYKKAEADYQQQKQQREQEKLTTRCPKCNGTSFTPVRKKFSLLAGFATNKIELVCNNCGTVVKPK